MLRVNSDSSNSYIFYSGKKRMNSSNRKSAMNRGSNYQETSDVITFGDLGKSALPGLLVGLPASLLGFTLIPIILKPFASALNDTFAGATGDESEQDRKK